MKKYIGLLAIILIAFTYVQAGKLNRKTEADSLRKATIAHRHALADSIRMHVETRVFSLEYADSLTLQIEHLHSTLNKINNHSKYGFQTTETENDLKDMEAAIQTISQSVGRDSMVMNVNNLQLYRLLLKDMSEKLHEWRDVLFDNKKNLSGMTAQMNAFVRDSLTEKVAADTAFANLHLDEMLILNEKWNQASSATKANLTRISKLQAEASDDYFEVTELQNVIGNQLSGIWLKIFKPEYSYIWNVQRSPSISDVLAFTIDSVNERMAVLKYYLTLNPEDWFYVALAGLIFFFWVYRNFKKLKALAGKNATDTETFKFIRAIPVLSTAIFILNLAPFYDFDQPAIYIEILHLLILIPLTLVLWRVWSRRLFYYWVVLVVLSVLTAVINAVITPGWPLRLLLLGVNVVSFLWGIRFFILYRKDELLGKGIKWVTVFYTVLSLLSVIANVSGRLTLAKIFTASGIIAITQLTGLFVLIPILTEAFYLQMKSSRISGGMALKFNYTHIEEGLHNLLTAAAVIGWAITLTTNLEIYNPILFFLHKLLNTPRLVGSTQFTIGNILTFVLILYIVVILQRYVGYFFGETEDDMPGDLDKKESRMVLFRLVIIMLGFFLAIVASGLPVDKVTVVLGALGVGIGLGLQNIVYNLVSGVILIFEKPMQIGDYIEVSDKKGRVHSIGIRSSKLITSDGSEVTVPNGDILSSHMVNWTRNNNHCRSELNFTIEPATQLQEAKEIILKAMEKDEHVIQDLPVEILVNNLSEKSGQISVNVWINSIYKEQAFKSEMISKIYTLLSEKGIKIL